MFFRYRRANKFDLCPLGPLTFIWGGPNGNIFSSLYHAAHVCKVLALRLLKFLRYRRAKKFELGPLGPMTFAVGAQMVLYFHPCNMPTSVQSLGPEATLVFEVQWSKDNGLEKEKEKKKTRRLQNIYACTSPPLSFNI